MDHIFSNPEPNMNNVNETDNVKDEDFSSDFVASEQEYEAISPPNAPGRISPDVVVTIGQPSKEDRETIFKAVGNTSGEYISLHFSRLIKFAMPLDYWIGDEARIVEPRVRLSTYIGSSYCYLADHDHPHGGVRNLEDKLNTQQVIEQTKRLIITPRPYEMETIEHSWWGVSALLKSLNWEGELMLFSDGELKTITLEEIDGRISEKTYNAIYFSNLYQVNMRCFFKEQIERVRNSLPDSYTNEFQKETWENRSMLFQENKGEPDTTALSESYIGRHPLALQLLYAIRRNFGIPYTRLQVKDYVHKKEFWPLLKADENHKILTWRGSEESKIFEGGALYFRGMWSSFAKRGFFEVFDSKIVLSPAAERLLTILGSELEDVDLPMTLEPYFNGEKTKEESNSWIQAYIKKIGNYDRYEIVYPQMPG
jgi:hypothetical protein